MNAAAILALIQDLPPLIAEAKSVIDAFKQHSSNLATQGSTPGNQQQQVVVHQQASNVVAKIEPMQANLLTAIEALQKLASEVELQPPAPGSAGSDTSAGS